MVTFLLPLTENRGAFSKIFTMTIGEGRACRGGGKTDKMVAFPAFKARDPRSFLLSN